MTPGGVHAANSPANGRVTRPGEGDVIRKRLLPSLENLRRPVPFFGFGLTSRWVVPWLERVEPGQGTTGSAGLPPLPPKGLMADDDPLKTSLPVPAEPVSAQAPPPPTAARVGPSHLRNPARRRHTLPAESRAIV